MSDGSLVKQISEIKHHTESKPIANIVLVK